MTDENTLLSSVSGWMAAAFAGVLNLLLLTWGTVVSRTARQLESRVDAVEREKVSIDTFKRHARQDESQHTAIFTKIDSLHDKIDDTRREIKDDIRMVADLVRNGRK